MKRFLRDIGLFSVVALLFFGALEWVAESIPNSYTYKRDYMEQHGAQIQTLILGSSNAYDGLNPSVLPQAFDLANSSQTLEDDYRLLAKYIESMDSLQTVIIGLGYHALGATSEEHRRMYYTIYMHLYPRWPIGKYSFEIFNLELLSKKIIKYIVSRDVTRCDSLGQRMGHTAAAVKEQNEFWNKDAATLAANDAFDSPLSTLASPLSTNIEYLYEIIHLCEAHHVQPVVVTMPVMAEYKGCLSPEQLALHDSVMSGLPSSAMYIDASDWDIPEDGWYNATHLTRETSTDFTKQLLDSIDM